jgi:hypothetical protein
LAVIAKLKSAINAFLDYDEYRNRTAQELGPSTYSTRPGLYGVTNERSIITAIYTKIAIDVAGIKLRHVKVDTDERYVDAIDSKLNLCLNFEANLDQGPRHFRQDIVTTMIDDGKVAIVPVDYTVDDEGKVEIYTLRTGRITQFYAGHVRMELWNEKKGIREEIVLPKNKVAIAENPFHSVMNGPNSTLQRLVRKLSTLDDVDASAGRLDMIIQLPYAVKSETQQNQAESRRKAIEFQLKESEYGIAYSGVTEKITQLNRPVENQLLEQVKRLTTQLYAELGITEGVMNGTADEAQMLNYINRTVEAILDAVTEAMTRSFLGPIRYQNGERVQYFRDPFKLVPLVTIAEIADKFSRNEILAPNEIRGFMGIIPSKDPKADKLINSNMPQYVDANGDPVPGFEGEPEEGEEDDSLVQGAFDQIDAALDETFAEFGVAEDADE